MTPAEEFPPQTPKPPKPPGDDVLLFYIRERYRWPGMVVNPHAPDLAYFNGTDAQLKSAKIPNVETCLDFAAPSPASPAATLISKLNALAAEMSDMIQRKEYAAARRNYRRCGELLGEIRYDIEEVVQGWREKGWF